MKIGFIIDPLETLILEMDTTLLMAACAYRKGHDVYIMTLDDLFLQNGDAHATMTAFSYDGNNTKALTDFCHSPHTFSLSFLDIVVMRKDPPVDETWIAATFILDFAKCHVINSPQGLREANEKIFPFHWPHLIPNTVIMRSVPTIMGFLKRQSGPWVLKPLNECSGKGIHKVDYQYDSDSIQEILTSITMHGQRYIVIQQFIDNVSKGDKRIFLLDGEPIGWTLRVPSDNDFRANIHLGARSETCSLTSRDTEIIQQITPKMKQLDIPLFCIDIIDGMLTEINVTSPSGIPQINQTANLRCEEKIITYFEKRIQTIADSAA